MLVRAKLKRILDVLEFKKDYCPCILYHIVHELDSNKRWRKKCPIKWVSFFFLLCLFFFFFFGCIVGTQKFPGGGWNLESAVKKPDLLPPEPPGNPFPAFYVWPILMLLDLQINTPNLPCRFLNMGDFIYLT